MRTRYTFTIFYQWLEYIDCWLTIATSFVTYNVLNFSCVLIRSPKSLPKGSLHHSSDGDHLLQSVRGFVLGGREISSSLSPSRRKRDGSRSWKKFPLILFTYLRDFRFVYIPSDEISFLTVSHHWLTYTSFPFFYVPTTETKNWTSLFSKLSERSRNFNSDC